MLTLRELRITLHPVGSISDHVPLLGSHLGNIADYVRSPRFVSSKIRPGTEVSDRQATLQGLNVAMLTALKVYREHSDAVIENYGILSYR